MITALAPANPHVNRPVNGGQRMRRFICPCGRGARAAAGAAIGLATVGGILRSADAQPAFEFAKPVLYIFDFDMYPTSIAAGDLNNDGFVDLVISGRNLEGKVLIMLGEGDGVLGRPMELLIESQTEWVSVRNFDLDGPLDLAVAVRGGDGVVAMFRGVGDGTFTDRTDHAVGRSPSSMAAEDFDGDGAIDLAVTNYESHDVSILLNDGQGGMNLWQTVALGGLLKGPVWPFYLTASDFDNDLDLDLVVGHLASNHVSFLRNQGDGVFSAAMTIPALQPVGVAAADMNLDGNTDVVMADLSNFEGKLVVLENQGGAQFAGLTTVDTGGWSWHVATPDLNGDGRPDVALTDVNHNLLILLPNESVGDMALGRAQFIPVATFPRFILVVDLDGDCDMDLVVASIGAHRLTVLLNETTQGSSCLIADLSGDGRVGASDLLILLADWNAPGGPADFDYNGHVNATDLLFLLNHWD
ncbi:MAG: FG-GAP-like repeat-containing protein [Planctomycetota bacterium]|nr:FG-GAP-like repeat-containing protein [Planctomycetota bacterium]